MRINDRGPFVRGRVIDLSFAAARRIGLDLDGVAPVSVEVVGRRRPSEHEPPSSAVDDEAVSVACWWVQVGAFGDPGNARRAVERLEAAGEHPVVVESPGGLARVRVGPFDAERAVEKALERILRDWPEAVLIACG